MGLGIPFPSSYSSPTKLWRYMETINFVGWEAMKDFPGTPRTRGSCIYNKRQGIYRSGQVYH